MSSCYSLALPSQDYFPQSGRDLITTNTFTLLWHLSVINKSFIRESQKLPHCVFSCRQAAQHVEQNCVPQLRAGSTALPYLHTSCPKTVTGHLGQPTTAEILLTSHFLTEMQNGKGPHGFFHSLNIYIKLLATLNILIILHENTWMLVGLIFLVPRFKCELFGVN